VLILLGGFGFVFYEVEHSRRNLEAEKTTHHALVGESTYANLESYIRRTLDMGYSRQQIMQAMLQEGWSQAIINKVFSRIR
jgi:SOS response regulatory protein OraA/RecX